MEETIKIDEIAEETLAEQVSDNSAEDMQDELPEATSLTLRTEHLFKKYGKRTVVNDVSINVKQGEIVGLLGPNGA